MSKSKKPKFKPGQLVLLHADPKDFDPPQPRDEVATILEYEGNGTYMVEVPQCLRFDDDGKPAKPYTDDGLREVGEDQIFPIFSTPILALSPKLAKEVLRWQSYVTDEPTSLEKKMVGELEEFTGVRK